MRSLLLGVILMAFFARADWEITGDSAVEFRYYPQQARYPFQSDSQASVYLQPELYMDWNNGDDSIVFVPYVRFDQQDNERSHADIRELMWLHVGDNWELRTGIGKVFWGQTESLHLVDVINQTDGVESVDGEDKLGQPMLNLSLIRDWGTTSIFVLPYFRERTFAGMDGRLRPPFDVLQDDALYESGAEQSHLDWAIRWQHSVGDWELGLSYFDGTSREPDFVQQTFFNEQPPVLLPYYAQMQQTGIDVLAAIDAWLLKFEGIYRDTVNESFWAMVGGFEYTSIGVFESIFDLGWLVEYQFDQRESSFWASGQRDLMLGSRLVFNDIDGTEVLLGLVQDLDTSASRSAFIEASSRINDQWKWRLEAYLFSSDAPPDPLYLFRRDDHVQLAIEYYF